MKLENSCHSFFPGKVAIWKPLDEYAWWSVIRALLVAEMKSFFDFILVKHKSFPPTNHSSSQFPSIFQNNSQYLVAIKGVHNSSKVGIKKTN